MGARSPFSRFKRSSQENSKRQRLTVRARCQCGGRFSQRLPGTKTSGACEYIASPCTSNRFKQSDPPFRGGLMLAIKHLLFPIDFSERCCGTAPFVGALASRLGAKITLLTAVAPFS